MIVTKLEFLDSKKVKVYIDYEYSFLLYTPDIKKKKIVENEEITTQVYEDIIVNTVLRRAKQKALAILKHMDRTEYELREKLKRADYTDAIIERTMEYISSYNYIDDERYTRYYIRTKKSAKSQRIIMMELANKGVAKDLITLVMEQEFVNDDVALLKAIAKKRTKIEDMTNDEKQKFSASLYRKGFKSEDIRKYIKY